MASERRAEKLNNLLREEIARIIDREVELPESVMATITKVHISMDGHYATVFFTALNAPEQQVQELLQDRVADVQHTLNRSLRMRPVPRIRFAPDEEELRRESVEKSIANIKEKEGLS